MVVRPNSRILTVTYALSLVLAHVGLEFRL